MPAQNFIGVPLLHPPMNSHIILLLVVWKLSKHGLESVDDPDDNLTPILHFCNKKCYGVLMRVINSAGDH